MGSQLTLIHTALGIKDHTSFAPLHPVVKTLEQRFAAILHHTHVRWVKTEEKAKVVAAVWGKQQIQFLAALAFFHLDDLEKYE